MSFLHDLEQAAELTQARLAAAMADFGDLPVAQGMRYAVQGGKALRGYLVIESARLYDIDPKDSVTAAAAIEAVHAYSLVHDDLPCMDDDDLRRGQPTVHVKWDEATAVLVGDALQTLAFELLARDGHADPRIRIELVTTLALASGAQGMVLGQAQDIAAETADAPLTFAEISELQRNKTGALIEWSAVAGHILAGGDDAGHLRHYARCLGLAFQIADDILDVEGDSAETGKAVGKDADAGKATFVSFLGLEEARARAKSLTEEACDSVAVYGSRSASLQQAAHFVVDRKK